MKTQTEPHPANGFWSRISLCVACANAFFFAALLRFIILPKHQGILIIIFGTFGIIQLAAIIAGLVGIGSESGAKNKVIAALGIGISIGAGLFIIGRGAPPIIDHL